jgi:hypothetical protein
MKKLLLFALVVCASFAMSGSASANNPVVKAKHAASFRYAASGTLANGNTYSVIGGSTPLYVSFFSPAGASLGSYNFSQAGTYYYIAYPTKVPTGYVRVEIVTSGATSITFYSELP